MGWQMRDLTVLTHSSTKIITDANKHSAFNGSSHHFMSTISFWRKPLKSPVQGNTRVMLLSGQKPECYITVSFTTKNFPYASDC